MTAPYKTSATGPVAKGEVANGPVVGAVSARRSSTPAEPTTGNRVIGVNITVRGNPVGQGRISFMGKGRAVHSNAATLKPWRELIAYTAAQEMGDRPPFEGPVFLRAAFTVARPKSAPKSRKRPDRRPDLGHYVRAVEDALSGIVYVDDSQIVEMWAGKFYPDELFRSLPFPGVRIYVESVTS